jgi:hypothetical protein
MIFINNKYTNTYYKIIEKAKNSDRNKSSIFESHHIIPKSIGGSEEKSNLVLLTLKEHFICHLLLLKMTEGKNKEYMYYAFNMMSNFKKYNSKAYSLLKTEFKKIHSVRMSGPNSPHFGKKQKKSTVEKRIANTDRNKLRTMLGKIGELNPNYGKILNDETKNKISMALTGKAKPENFQKGEKNSNYGKKHPNLNSGKSNAMFGLFGIENPNYGSKRTDEQKENIKISKTHKNMHKYFYVIELLMCNTSLKEIHAITNVSMWLIYKIKKGNHIACKLYKESHAI